MFVAPILCSVFVGGPYLVRTATTSGGTLKLTGDNNGTTSIEFFAPSAVSRLSWNSKSVPVFRTPYGSYKGTLGTVKTVTPPSLGSWKVIGRFAAKCLSHDMACPPFYSLPEVEPGFDDSSFITCSQTATNVCSFLCFNSRCFSDPVVQYTLAPLAGDKVLYSQQYGCVQQLDSRARAARLINLTLQYLRRQPNLARSLQRLRAGASREFDGSERLRPWLFHLAERRVPRLQPRQLHRQLDHRYMEYPQRYLENWSGQRFDSSSRSHG